MVFEPVLHSHITDGLPDTHLLACRDVWCCKCDRLVHDDRNLCRFAWFEWLGFAICFDCFAKYCYEDGVVSVPGFMVKAN